MLSASAANIMMKPWSVTYWHADGQIWWLKYWCRWDFLHQNCKFFFQLDNSQFFYNKKLKNFFCWKFGLTHGHIFFFVLFRLRRKVLLRWGNVMNTSQPFYLLPCLHHLLRSFWDTQTYKVAIRLVYNLIHTVSFLNLSLKEF